MFCMLVTWNLQHKQELILKSFFHLFRIEYSINFSVEAEEKKTFFRFVYHIGWMIWNSKKKKPSNYSGKCFSLKKKLSFEFKISYHDRLSSTLQTVTSYAKSKNEDLIKNSSLLGVWVSIGI